MSPDVLASWGPLGATAVLLALSILTLVKQRKNGRPWTGEERRTANPDLIAVKAELVDVKADVKEIRTSVHDIRDRLLQPLVTKVAVLEHRVGDLEHRES